MKKNRKNHHAGRMISLLLVFCMTMSLLSVTAFATASDTATAGAEYALEDEEFQQGNEDSIEPEPEDEPAYDDGNIPETHTVNFGSGSWIVGEQIVTADKTGTVDALSMDEVITLTGFDANTMQAKLTAEDGFYTTLTVADGKTSLSAKNSEVLPGGTLVFSVEANNNSEEPEPEPEPAPSDPGELRFTCQGEGATGGSIYYKLNNTGDFIQVGEENGQYNSITLKETDTSIAIRLVANEGYQLDTTRGVTFRVNGADEFYSTDENIADFTSETGYTFDLAKLAGGSAAESSFELEFGFENAGEEPGPGPDEDGLTIELGGSSSVSKGIFTYDNGMARVVFVSESIGNDEIIENDYDGSEDRITLADDVTAVKIILTADDGYQGAVMTGGNNPPVPKPEVNGSEYTYTFARGEIEEAGSFVAFNIEFTEESGGEDPITWHTVSWGGENVTVENGTVAAERIHLGDRIFTVNEEESGASDSDNIYPIDDIIGEEGQEGLGEYGLGYGDTDLFIDNSVEEDVSIDFRFVPDYGYQLADILTNETESMLGDFTASVSEISTFNFKVHPEGNVHFNVVFAAAKDIIDVTSTSVTDASIANGENATDSGNLKMTVADVHEKEVSEELKAQAGENALYLDMNLYQVVSKGGENGNWENQLEELSGAITVTLSVPAPVKGNAYYIIREHGDGDNKTYDLIGVTFVPDKNDPTMGTVTFETDKFSTYAIVTQHTHIVSGWKSDADNHWKECSDCGEQIKGSEAAHSYGDDNVCDICGYTATNTWLKLGTSWYWFNADGVMAKSAWLPSGTSWYYLKSNGAMAAGEKLTIGSSEYIFNATGKMATGWTAFGGKWYYAASSGALVKNGWAKSGSSWYWLKADGVMAKNEWVAYNGSWYWLKSSGVMAKNEWVAYNGSWYWLKSSGVMAKSEWVAYNGSWYWLKSSGVMAKSAWLEYNGYWYYLKSNGVMAKSETLTINGKVYKFNSSGRWVS